MSDTIQTPTISCSFCGRATDHNGADLLMLSAPTGVTICSDCVVLASEELFKQARAQVLAAHAAPGVSQSALQLENDRLRAALNDVREFAGASIEPRAQQVNNGTQPSGNPPSAGGSPSQ